MLQVQELSKQIHNFRLDNINLHLPKGYIMGLIGENGAGKTSFIKCLLDIYRKDYGHVIINGMDLDQEEAKVKASVGVVMEDSMFEKNLSVLKNATIYGKLFPEFDEVVFRKYMDKFGVDSKKKLGKLSKGMEMKFQIAFAISHNAKLLIMDEPAGNLDERSRQELTHILQEFISDGERSVLISTHITAQLDEIADYITYMHNGKIIFSCDKEQLYDEYMLVSGEDYKIRLIPKELIIGIEKHPYSTEALIKRSRRYCADGNVQVTVPTMEKLMYYMNKGGFDHV